jgi:hypothetical protein
VFPAGHFVMVVRVALASNLVAERPLANPWWWWSRPLQGFRRRQVSAASLPSVSGFTAAVPLVSGSRIMIPIAKADELKLTDIDPASLAHPTHRWTKRDAAAFGFGEEPPTEVTLTYRCDKVLVVL